MNPTNEQELREQLAAIEHERWADWQRYCNMVLRARVTDERTLEERLQHWDRQIATPYAVLSEKEKDSDREQVDRYWHLVEAHTNAEIAKVLDRLETEMPSQRTFCNEYNKALKEVSKVIQAERNKLKEQSDDTR